MRKVMRIVLALIVVIMAVSQPAYADRGRHGGWHGHARVGVFVGPGWWGPGWSPGWWGPYPYYPPRSPVIVEQPAEIYVQPAPAAEAPRYWYFCKDPQGYYPAVKRCPDGWMKVVPPSPPADEEE
jgi:hypothetical protein